MYPGIIQKAKDAIKKLNPEIDLDYCGVVPCENKTRLTFEGVQADMPPFEGEVVFIDDNSIVIKESLAYEIYVIVAKALATQVPEVGSKVRVTPYFRRNFDGSRADGCLCDNGINSAYDCPYAFGKSTTLPFERPAGYYMGYLYDQLNQLKAPDNVRNIAQLLVDASARDFIVFDHDDDVEVPARIEFFVSTDKFTGKVSVLYEHITDLYLIFLWDGDDVVASSRFTSEALADLIDDGSWNKIQIEVIV